MKIKKWISSFILNCFYPFIFLYELLFMPYCRWYEYTIAKGKHRSALRFKPVFVDECMAFKVRFDSSSVYTLSNREDQWDMNKVWGFSEYLFSPHLNSARIGWNYRDGQLYLRPYSYCNGVSQLDPPEIPIPLNQDIECLIMPLKDRYSFYINGESFQMPRAGRERSFMALQLYPYFGGNQKAPHTIRMWLQY